MLTIAGFLGGNELYLIKVKYFQKHCVKNGGNPNITRFKILVPDGIDLLLTQTFFNNKFLTRHLFYLATLANTEQDSSNSLLLCLIIVSILLISILE